jgi:hypothetical protein
VDDLGNHGFLRLGYRHRRAGRPVA